MAEALGIENPNGPSSIKIATAVMKLDSAKTVKAKNGDGSGSRSGTAHYLVLAHGTAQVPGRRTTANMLAFPPLRLPGLLTRGCPLVSPALLAAHRLSANCPLRALSLKSPSIFLPVG